MPGHYTSPECNTFCTSTMPQGSKSRAPNWKSSETLDLLQAIKVHIEKEDLDPAKYLETTGPWRRLKWSNPHSRSLEHVHSKLINLSKVAVRYSSHSRRKIVTFVRFRFFLSF